MSRTRQPEGAKIQALGPTRTVGVFVPAGPPDPHRLSQGLSLLAARYRVLGPSPLPDPPAPYLAGPDDARAAALDRLLRDTAISCLWAARGGYGSVRLLELLSGQGRSIPRKLLVGFSDVTVLLELWSRAGRPALHGPVVTQLPRLDPDSLDHLWTLLEDPDYRPVYRAYGPVSGTGVAAGRTWGGNLTVLASLVGILPPPAPAPPRIAVLEDVAEPPYRLDRAVTQLAMAGWLRGVRAAALGQVTDPAGRDVSHALASRLEELGIPTLSGLPWGHGTENRAVALGLPAELDFGEKTLRVLDAPVAPTA